MFVESVIIGNCGWNMYDIIIIGAGPAGLTACLYALRNSKTVLLLEKNVIGGQILNTPLIENYPAIGHINGIEFIQRLKSQTEGAVIKYERAVKIVNTGKNKCVYTEENKYISKAVIIAAGLIRKKLGIDGEEKFIGRGVSYCATCDGPFFKGKRVAVIGGGNTAMSEAIHLAQLCEKVYLICRSDAFKGEEKNKEKIREYSNIHIYKNTIPIKITGKESVEAVEVKKNDDKREAIKVDGVFVAIGQGFEKDFEFEGIDDNDKYIKADESCRTKVEGVFAAGDCREKKIRQLVTANADGAAAALGAIDFIRYNI